MIKLSKRLQQIADFVPLGTKVADIGTDHALLPCYLVQEKISPSAIATDVNKGPLEIAKKQVKDLLLDDRVAVRLGDGLKPIKPLEVETVTISGMGGATIKDILDKSPEVTKGLQRLILQPNVAAWLVRSWALENGWKIVDEELIYEDEKYYEVIVLEPGKMEIKDQVYLTIGPKLLEKYHINLVPYLKSQWQKEQELLTHLENINKEETRLKVQAIREEWDKIRRVISCHLNVEI